MDVISVRALTCENCGKQFRRHLARSLARRAAVQTDCLDADGRLPTDPTPEEIEAHCERLRAAHLAAKRLSNPTH